MDKKNARVRPAAISTEGNQSICKPTCINAEKQLNNLNRSKSVHKINDNLCTLHMKQENTCRSIANIGYTTQII